MRERESLFDAHISTLASKRRAALHRVFETHAPGLDAEAEDVLPLVKEDPAMERAPLLGLVRDDGSGKRGDGKREEGERDGGDEDGERKLREAFESWQRERKQKAREEFQVMLKGECISRYTLALRQR